ncbi:MAG: FAD-binding protein [Novosphingobium sp.]|nr:FAD-binding protein [Novosphingobium sp.]
MAKSSKRAARPFPGAVDVVIAGSGAGALTGAITARRAGLSVIVVEKEDVWGGTTALSGGGVWIPDNSYIRENGLEDSDELAMAYLDDIVADAGPATSHARKLAYVRQGKHMIDMLRSLGFDWIFKTTFPDYYPDRPGSRPGRSLSPATIDGKRLGPEGRTLRKSLNYPPLVFSGKEMWALLAPFRGVKNAATFIKVLLKSAGWFLSGRRPVSMGRALLGQLMLIAKKLDVPLYLNSELVGIGMDQGRVVSVDISCGGEVRTVHVRRGVLIGAGGFSRNAALRSRHQPLDGSFSAAAPGDTGGPIALAEELGAATGLMDEAWWMPVVILPDGNPSITLWERAMPHSIIVDRKGSRFMNEAAPYNDSGRAILDRNAVSPSIPSWLIMDGRHRFNYAFTKLPSAFTPRGYIRSGFFIRAGSLAELARKCGLDEATLATSVARFNGFVHNGRDEDFGRGESPFDRSWGDPTVSPNPNLGTLEKPPFWAVRIYPGDIGTKGGLVTDESGRVVDKAGRPIEGLYATGNSTASVMGRTYPGAGSTLGPAMVFAYVGMRHLAGLNDMP